jgi:hypothetical protein
MIHLQDRFQRVMVGAGAEHLLIVVVELPLFSHLTV